MKKKVVVLGAGRVGRAMAADLAPRYDVMACDVSVENLGKLPPDVRRVQADIREAAVLGEIVAEADLVIGAVPGFMGFETLRRVIHAGKNVVDISFFPEDCFLLDEEAKQRGVMAVVDCGVAPGLFNILVGYHNERMAIHTFTAMCGGLPRRRALPFQYKAPFSPVDVLEIYTRPARIVVNGLVQTVPALSDVELVEVDPIGTLEAFNTDGLRSLLTTMRIPNMREKTLRYPGHAQFMEQLRAIGLFSDQPLSVGGCTVRPIDVAMALFFPQWKYEEGEEEFTVLRVTMQGEHAGQPCSVQYDLFDTSVPEKGTSSMERTTGYTATAVATALLEGLYEATGIVPPEFLGRYEKMYSFVLDYLAERSVNVRRQISKP